jgi:hypothetical protein
MQYNLPPSSPLPLTGIFIEAGKDIAQAPRSRKTVESGDMVRITMVCLVATISAQYGIDERARARPKLNDMARHIYPGT